MVERNQAKPLYQVVADSILQKINDGELNPGQKLSSESELRKIYSVGRNTIRHAITELVNLGVLKTIHGVGTFVAEDRYLKTAEFLYGFSQEMSIRGKSVSSEVLDAKLINADPFLARRLHIQLGAEVVFLYRLRLMDGEPTTLERAYLPHEYCPGILEYDFSNSSLYEILATKYGMRPDHAEQEIEADLATPEVAKLLKLDHPAVVLIFHRETRTRDGRVIEYVDSELRADRFRFYTNLKASNTQAIIFERLPTRLNRE